MKKLILIGGVFLSAFAGANTGGWSSGGGNVLKNGNNPWFLKNTAEVKYCVLRDQATFSGIPLVELIDRALSYWKAQLADPLAQSIGYPISDEPMHFETIKIGTQTFQNISTCDGTEDITFQFGILTDEQKAYLRDPQSLVGIAVRTHYDEENLRGKGFIYISPDSGPNRYRGDHLRENAWHEGMNGVLYRAIAHELGHVFGLPHGGTGLMSEAYSESLLSKHKGEGEIANLASLANIPPFFHFESSPFTSNEAAHSNLKIEEVHQLFGPEFHYPNRIELTYDEKRAAFVLEGNFIPEGKRELGFIGGVIEKSSGFPSYGVTIFLTNKQKVFPFGLTSYLRLMGPMVRGMRLVGKFVPTLPGAKEMDVVLMLHPDFVSMDAIFDGKFRPGIFDWRFSVIGW